MSHLGNIERSRKKYIFFLYIGNTFVECLFFPWADQKPILICVIEMSKLPLKENGLATRTYRDDEDSS